jgi:hypothetical protein
VCSSECKTVSKLHDITTENTRFFIVTTMGIANPIFGLFPVSDLLTVLHFILIYSYNSSLSCKKWNYTLVKIRPLML